MDLHRLSHALITLGTLLVGIGTIPLVVGETGLVTTGNTLSSILIWTAFSGFCSSVLGKALHAYTRPQGH